MKARRLAMSAQAIQSATEAIQAHLLGLDVVDDAPGIFTYVSSSVEPGTYTLIQALLAEGKRVCVPRIDADNRIQPHLIASLDDLQPGGTDQFNLPVPAVNSPIESSPCPAVTLVPGLAYTRTGQRLGMGGGYYDRFLAAHPDTFSIGLCYGWQLLDSLPTEPHDQRVGMLITEAGVVSCR